MHGHDWVRGNNMYVLCTYGYNELKKMGIIYLYHNYNNYYKLLFIRVYV